MMMEVKNFDIRAIEDRELRELVRYEKLIAWGRSGALRKAADAYYAQIAQAEKDKAVAKLRVAQIQVIEKTTTRWDARAARNALAAENAAKQQASAIERQATQEAVDEVLALEEIVPEKDIDDILSQLSAALDIELPTSGDRVDICQRGPKTMDQLKKELGPSLWTKRMVAHGKSKDRFEQKVHTDRYAKLIRDYSTSILSHHHIKEHSADEQTWVSSFDSMIACRDHLYEAITTLRDYAAHLVEKQTPAVVLQRNQNDFSVLLAEYNVAHRKFVEIDIDPCPVTSAEWQRRKNLFDDQSQRLKQYVTTGIITPPGYDVQVVTAGGAVLHVKCPGTYPFAIEPDEPLDAETLEIAKGVVCDPFDAGLTLEQIRSISSPGKPPDPLRKPMTREEALVMMAT